MQMFSNEEIQLLKKSYNDALAEDIKKGKHENDLFAGILGIAKPLDLSADETMINTLDEEMTENQFLEWGPTGDQELTVLQHYIKHNATVKCDFSIHGLRPNRRKKVPPFRFEKPNKTDFTQEQRKFVLNLLHLAFEKGSLSKQQLLSKIGIQ